MSDQAENDKKDTLWRRLGVVGSFVDAAVRLAELFLRR